MRYALANGCRRQLSQVPLVNERRRRKMWFRPSRPSTQSALFGQQYELTFDMDRESHRALLRLVDRNTREVVRQIPPEYVLRLARELKRDRVGR